MADLGKVDPLTTESKIVEPGKGTPSSFLLRQWQLIRAFVNAAATNLTALAARVLALENTNIAVTAPITGGGLLKTPPTAIGHANSGVTAATYGDATHVAQVAVDAKGHVTGATNVAITAGVPTTRAINTTAPLAGGGTLAADLTLSLNDTAVTPATYGDATHVPQIAIDQKGRITSAANVPISGGAGGAIQGALTYRVTNQAILSATDTLVQFTTTSFDDNSYIDLGTHNTRITIPSGISRAIVTAFVQFDGVTSQKFFQIKKNGNFSYVGAAAQSAGNSDRANMSTEYMLVSAGDYFEVNVNTAGARNVTEAYFSILAFP